MDKRSRPREDKLEETPRGALDWLLQHLRFSYLLGVEPKEHQRGVLQYWPLVVVLLSVVAVHATLDDDIAVLPPLMLLALVLVVLVPIFYARRRACTSWPASWGGPRNSFDGRGGRKRVPPSSRVARRADGQSGTA